MTNSKNVIGYLKHARHHGTCGYDPANRYLTCQCGLLGAAGYVEELQAQLCESEDSLMKIRAGHTKTVEYDLSPAMVESRLRDKLIELGWTAPEDKEDE